MKAGLAATMLVLAFAGPPGRSAEPARPCCAEDAKGAAQAARPGGRSIYQVDSTWTDDAGRPASLASLQGRPVVLAMFFTNCEFACPIIVGNIRRVREALAPALRDRTRFVLVSFDSERDTPAALSLYRGRMGLGDGWMLLHGSPYDVRELAMVLGVKYSRDSRGQFAHSNLITVLDCKGEIAFQQAGLNGSISEVAKAVTLAAR